MFETKRSITERVPRLMYSIYRRYKSKSLSWAVAGRKYTAPIDPFQLYWVDPNNIDYIQKDSGDINKHPYYVSEVKEGPWDKQVVPIDKHDFFESLEMRFNNNTGWKDTPWVKRTIQDITERGLTPYGCTTADDFEKRLAQVDQLYHQIQNQGYKTQRELMTGASDSLGHDWARFCPELHEIVLNIGRDGQLIFEDGWHRLGMARLLGIQEVPVRINIRHLQWQHRREELLEKRKHGVSWNPHHPALRPIK